MKLRNVAIAALSVLTLFGGGAAVYGTSQVRAAQQQFVYSGYLLDGSENQENGYAKYTFEAGTTYKTGYPDSVIFKDTAGVQVATSRNAFLHYADGSLSALTDGVIVDLNNMSNGMLNNFGINAGTILERRDSSYVVDSISGTLYLDDFLWKINDSQYILVSSTIDITTGNQAPIYYNDYVEMRYYNEGILMLITENGAYRTVASDCVATVNSGIQLDLSARTVTTDEEGTKMSMEQIVLDSNQVIDVLKPIMSAQKSDDLFSERQMNEAIKVALPTFEVIDGEDGKTGEVGEDGEDGEAGEDGQKGLTGADGLTGKTGENGKTGIDGIAGPDGAGGAPGAPGEPGVAGTSGTSGKNGQNGMGGPGGTAGAKGQDGIDGNESIEKENIVEEHEQLVLPEFSFADFKVTENSVSATLEIDSIAILKNNVVVDLLRAADGKLIGTTAYEPIEEYEGISFTNLLPDTAYLVRVKATYSATDATGATHDYENVFLTKQFTTNAIGVYAELVVREEHSLTFRVVIPEYSDVKGCKLRLRNANNSEDTQVCEMDEYTGEYRFGNLHTDTPYYVDIVEIRQNNVESGMTVEIVGDWHYYTLKKKPTLSVPEVFVNKVDSVFEMSLPVVEDPDNGIQYYRYEVYEGNNVASGALSRSFQIPTNRTVYCPVDGETIKRNVSYVLCVIAGFHDNEKIIEYSVESVPFAIDGVEWPNIHFERSNESKHDVLAGNIILSMNQAELKENEVIRVYYRSSSGKTKEWTQTVTRSMAVSGSATYNIPFRVEGLCARDTYVCDVYGTFSLRDETEDGSYWRTNERLGSFIEKTLSTGTVSITVEHDKEDYNNRISFRMSMRPITEVAGADAEATKALNQYAYDTASGMRLEILDIAGNSVYSHDYENGDDRLASKLGDGKYISITENEMPGVMGLISGSEYKVKLTKLYDHTEEENAIQVNGDGVDLESELIWHFKMNEKLPNAKEIAQNPLSVRKIRNDEAESKGGTYNSNIPGDATVGFLLSPNYPNLTGQEEAFVFYAFLCSEAEGYKFKSTESTATDFYLDNEGILLLTQREEIIVGEQNKVPETVIWLDGTEHEWLTRGHKFAFSYEVDLGKAGFFPDRQSEYIFLSAKEEKTAALAPYIKPEVIGFEHWNSGENGELVYKYKIKADDKDAVSKEFEGSDKIESKTIIMNQVKDGELQQQELKLSGLTNGENVNIRFKSWSYEADLFSVGVEEKTHVAIAYTYESKVSLDNVTVSYQNKEDSNRVMVTVSGKSRDLKRIPAFELTVAVVNITAVDVVIDETTKKTMVLPIKGISSFEDEATITAYVDYSKLDGYIGKQIVFELVAKYDNGVAGYQGVNGVPVAIQTLPDKKYVKLNASGEYQCNTDDSASDSWFELKGIDSKWANGGTATHVLSEQSRSLTLKPEEGGTTLPVIGSTVIVKRLAEHTVECKDETNILKIDEVMPAITLTDNSGNKTIDTSNAWANVRFVLSGYSTLLKENVNNEKYEMQLFMEVWNAEEDGTIKDKIKTLSTTISVDSMAKGENPYKGNIEIEGILKPNMTYAVRFYYNSGGSTSPSYPLDTDHPEVKGENCYFLFRTKGNIELTNPTVAYSASSYNLKQIMIEVEINDNRGYDIIYSLKDGNTEISSDELKTRGILGRTESENITELSSHLITLKAIYGIKWFDREDLYLIATPVAIGSEEPIGDSLSIPLVIDEPPTPSFDILPIPSSSKLGVRIRAIDPGHQIYNDEYKLELLDEDGNPVESPNIAEKYNTFEITTVYIEMVKIGNKEVSLSDDSLRNKKWKIRVTAKYNTDEDKDWEKEYKSTTGSVGLSTTDVFFGTVELYSVGNRLALYFMDSVDLQLAADKMAYTVFSGSSYKPYVVDFGVTPIQQVPGTTAEDNLYYILLNEKVAQDPGTYRIEFSFIKDNEVVESFVFNYFKPSDK